jgi:hypothetical protein
MTEIEKLLKKNSIDNISNYAFGNFKKNNPAMYKTVLETLNEINTKRIKSEYLILLKPDINKVTLTIGKPKTFIFCGNFVRKDKKVMLLENVDTIGTYFLDDVKIIRQLKDLKIGITIRLERNEIGINLTLPYESTNVGLFD